MDRKKALQTLVFQEVNCTAVFYYVALKLLANSLSSSIHYASHCLSRHSHPSQPGVYTGSLTIIVSCKVTLGTNLMVYSQGAGLSSLSCCTMLKQLHFY